MRSSASLLKQQPVAAAAFLIAGLPQAKVTSEVPGLAAATYNHRLPTVTGVVLVFVRTRSYCKCSREPLEP
jgi:hypothetical protein